MPPKAKQQQAKTPAKGDIQVVDGKRKFTPRAPIPAAERLPRLYRALTDQVNDGYFDNAKKTCKRSESELGGCDSGIGRLCGRWLEEKGTEGNCWPKAQLDGGREERTGEG